MKVFGFSLFLAVVFASVSQAALLTPSAYLAFDDPAAGAAISPFASTTFSYFHLEDFEDNALNTLGVSNSTGAATGPGGNTDSVDEDDGSIDGSGTNGRSYFRSSGAAGLAFSFSEALLGSLPTHAGIVWTDGLGQVTFRAYDENNLLIGSSFASPATTGTSGQTDEDTFFGVVHLAGISRIEIFTDGGGGIEIDHLQYGLLTSTPQFVIPEPASGGLWLLGFGLLRRFSKRRQPGAMATLVWPCFCGRGSSHPLPNLNRPKT